MWISWPSIRGQFSSCYRDMPFYWENGAKCHRMQCHSLQLSVVYWHTKSAKGETCCYDECRAGPGAVEPAPVENYLLRALVPGWRGSGEGQRRKGGNVEGSSSSRFHSNCRLCSNSRFRCSPGTEPKLLIKSEAELERSPFQKAIDRAEPGATFGMEPEWSSF